MTRRLVLPILSAFVLVATLAACTITIVPGDGPVAGRAAVIESFESNRASYQVGDRITFRIETSRPGYVTLTALDPDGDVYTFARNLPVTGRGVEFLAGLSARQPFIAAPPTGLHVVRAHFTTERTPERVVFLGRRGNDEWTAAIRLELSGTGFTFDDVAQTRFDIRR